MLKEGIGFSRVIVCCGRVDLRMGITGLTAYVKLNYGLDAAEKGTLFLFCGNRADRIKGLIFEGLSADYCYPHIFSFLLKRWRFNDPFFKNVRITLSTAGRRCVLVRLHRPAIQAPRFPMR